MNLFSFPLLLTLVFTTATLSQAETVKAEPKTAASDTKKPQVNKTRTSYPIYGQLVSLTSKTLTLRSGEDKPERKFTLTKDTVILKDNKPSTVDAAKEGQWIGGSVSKSETGHDRVLKLNLSAKAKGSAKTPAKPAAEKKA